MRRGVASLVLVAVVGLFGTGSAASHPARLHDEQPDAIGDSGPGPDISAVDVEVAKDGKITWHVKFANRGLLLTPDFVQIFIDGDLRLDNGPGGFERVIQAELPLPSSGVFKWNGSDYVRESSNIIIVGGQGEVSATLNLRDLESETVRFYVYADTTPTSSDNFSDEAPEAPNSYLFQDLVPLVEDSFVPPKVIRAGQRLSVGVGVWTDNNASPSSSCRARIGRKTLAGKASWRSTVVPSPVPDAFAGPLSYKGTVSCGFAVPRSARGKAMTVTIVLRKEGQTLRKVFTTKVR